MATRTSNAFSTAGRKDFSTVPQFLATIDFGTTHCSVAYLLRPDLEPRLTPSEVDPIVLKLDNDGNRRVPSCILFDPDGKKIAFGQEAREQYSALDHEERPQYHYFEHVKKNLQHDEKIDRNQKVSDMNGKEFFLVDVIAHILHDLKCRLLTVVRDFGYEGLNASDFDWVITVPAFWKSEGGEMMREAGYMAGLCSDAEPPNLSAATGNRSPPQVEKSPEKLLLALEPESAAVHCQLKAKVAGRRKEDVKADRYLVIDVGGGTADIASVSTHIEENTLLSGNSCGGTIVNEEFSKFLQEFVGDREFSRYVQSGSPEKQARHKADLNELIYATFETQKRRFGSGDGRDSYLLEFPRSFVKLYEDALVKKGREFKSRGDRSVRVEDDGEVMRIRKSKMTEFFQPAVDGIVDLIESHLQQSKSARTIDTIYLVGGFGGCKYLRNQLQEVIRKTFRGFTFRFPAPPQPELAVIRGATTIRCDPNMMDLLSFDPIFSDQTLTTEVIEVVSGEKRHWRDPTHELVGPTYAASQAFVSLVTNDNYAMGAICLGRSLRDVFTSRKLALLITNNVSTEMRNRLSILWDELVVIEELDSGDVEHLALLMRPELGVTFSKIHAWRLTHYTKCVFLDADTLVLQNVDELFDREELSAAPDIGWPDCFNTGVFVFVPSLQTFRNLLNLARQSGSFDGGDQGLLNLYWGDWATKDIKYHLPFIYNVVPNVTYGYAPAFQRFGRNIKIIHFIGPVKPWHHHYLREVDTVIISPGTYSSQNVAQDFIRRWWHIYLSTEQDQEIIDDQEKHRRAFEAGRIDYMGQDRFQHIQEYLDSLLD